MTFKKVYDRITPSINRINDRLEKVPQAALDYFVKKTPKRGGNARRKTKLVNKRVISADYPYAKRLDKGYSKKAPEGMSKPTGAFIKALVKIILKRK
jgi:hypothetical protein